MGSFDRAEFKYKCAKSSCKSDQSVRYSQAWDSRKLRCSRCGSEIELDSSAANDLRSAVRDIEKGEERLSKALSQIFKNAKLQIKM